MSVLIKGFKMPKECRDCPLEMYYMNIGETRCRAENKILTENFKTIPFDGRPDWCPLVEVPAPHGDLIDKSQIKAMELEDSVHFMRWERNSEVDFQIEAPTVIEAEGTDD